MKTAQQMLHEFQQKRAAQPKPVPEGGFFDAPIPDPAESEKRLAQWPALPRYLVEELVRSGIDKTKAIRVVRNAWINSTQPGTRREESVDA